MDLLQAQRLWDPQPGWLNTASYGLPPTPAFAALQSALADWQRGRTSWEVWGESTERARAAFGRLVGARSDQVAVGSTVSELVGLLAASLPDGTEVLLPSGEFTSVVFPWAAHADRGVTVREAALNGLAAAVRPGTGVVALSLVQSADGAIADLPAVIGAARAVGALVVLDVTQACGWLPVSADGVDAIVCGAYKWLMSPRGSAFLALTDRLIDTVRPLSAGWYAAEDVHGSYYGLPMRLAASARQFDVSPAWFSWVGTAPALELIEEIGVAAIGEHNVRLANRFLAGLGRPPGQSAIVSVDVPQAARRLEHAGIRAAVRAGSLRASFHVYSTDDDVDAALTALTD